MAEQNKSLEKTRWERRERHYNGSVYYQLQLNDSELLGVKINDANVCISFEMLDGSETVIYKRESGDIETYKHTLVGRIITGKTGKAPSRILGNKEKFLNSTGFDEPDKTLVRLALDSLQEEF